MKALIHKRYGPPDVIQLADVPRPSPGPYDVLVRVHASAVNTSDWRIRAAAFPGITALPARLIFGLCRPRTPWLGSEFAGVVETVGAEVTTFAPGQRVFGITSKGGASAEYLAVSQDAAIAESPQGLTFIDAAALPFGGLAALVFLEKIAGVQENQAVLIVGASGGVGSYAVQIAKAHNARVTGLSGPHSQHFVRKLGADVTLDYTTTRLAEIRDRYDVILDAAGTLSPRLSRQLLRPGGQFLPLNIGWRELGAAIFNRFRDRKIRLAVNPNTGPDLRRLAQLVRDGDVRPVVDTVYSMSEASIAHAHVQSRHRTGAIVLAIEAEGKRAQNPARDWQKTRGICPNRHMPNSTCVRL